MYYIFQNMYLQISSFGASVMLMRFHLHLGITTVPVEGHV